MIVNPSWAGFDFLRCKQFQIINKKGWIYLDNGNKWQQIKKKRWMSRSHLCKISSLARRRKTLIFSFEFVALAHSALLPWKAEVCEEGVLWIVKLAPWNVVSYPTRLSSLFIFGFLYGSSIFLTSSEQRNIVQLRTTWNVAAHGGLVGGEDPHEDGHGRGGWRQGEQGEEQPLPETELKDSFQVVNRVDRHVRGPHFYKLGWLGLRSYLLTFCSKSCYLKIGHCVIV